MLKTRIRELRKARNLTLKELATKVGTTAQTIQRLETANMTVSTDWLERLANALGVPPLDLVDDESNPAIPMLGELGRDGLSAAKSDPPPAPFRLDLAALNPIAVRLRDTIGPYRSGSVLVADRLHGGDLANAHGRDCLVSLESGMVLLRRIAAGRGSTVSLIPLTSGEDIRYDIGVIWLARLVLEIRSL